MSNHHMEVVAGRRFRFGRNWARFLGIVDRRRIEQAEASLVEAFGGADFRGRRFLDIGSGSGLFSLAARRLGARVHSFDYDPQSVACTLELKHRFFPDDPTWTVEDGSALDPRYIESLGRFDIVYSFGVLHHTGDMYRALHNAQLPVDDEGLLFVAIYNDRGFRSRLWRGVKRLYCRGRLGRAVVVGTFVPWFVFSGLLKDLLRLRAPWRRYVQYRQRRGMSIVYDWLDWLGGYPFEVARPEEIFRFYRQRGFTLEELWTTPGDGTNHFVFRKTGPGAGDPFDSMDRTSTSAPPDIDRRTPPAPDTRHSRKETRLWQRS
ncbi:MAG: class I SAM-dependent methyltransferase [Pirellulales bacterium]|nr:class I SAM-dependent methyltransferase [Pirellulales bacterium]